MMEYWVRRTVDLFLLFSMVGHIFLAIEANTIPSFCTSVTLGRVSHEIIPVKVKDSSFPEPHMDSLDLKLELCPDNRTLKISWRMNSSQDVDTRLCFKVTSIYSGDPLYKMCVTFGIQLLKGPSALTCRFPMRYFSHRPIISAIVEATEDDLLYNYFGQINTSGLDPQHTCGSNDVCEVTTIQTVTSVIYCTGHSYVMLDVRVTVIAMWFESIESSSCRRSPVTIYRQSPNRLNYSMNCAYHGLGHLKVYYKVNGRFCLRYHLMRVICDNVTTTSSVPTTTTISDPDDFTTFVIFGVVCMIVITAIAVTTNFVVQRLRLVYRTRHHYKARGSANFSPNESVPLRMNNITQQEATVVVPVHVDSASTINEVIEQAYLEGVESKSSETQGAAASITKGQSTRRLHRVMTAALLEDTGAHYRKKILFLPTPFDPFSRDATDLLKTLFTVHLNVPTQCCYDRDVYQKYMDKNTCRYNWIENLLGDYNRVLIFLCFTTIGGEARKNTVVDDVLEHILLTRIRPHCKVAFLHVTDSSENLEKNHHGNSFHLSDRDTFREFLAEVMDYCGRLTSSEPERLYRLANSETSTHFQNYLGIR